MEKNNISDVFVAAAWLTFPDTDANLTRTIFELKDIKKAALNITALGFFEAYVNGEKVCNYQLIPAMSDYEKRDFSNINMPIYDTLSHRIYYYSFDVARLLKNGKNVLACHIGAGWYGQHESLNEGMQKWGDNTFVFSLEITHGDGSVSYINSSGDNTKWKKSYILETSLYYGEYHDARKYPQNWKSADFDDSGWLKSKTRPAPVSLLCRADFPADIVAETLFPKVISKFGDRKIYDIGVFAAGYAVIVFNNKAETNDRAALRYSDELNEDGSLQFHYCGGTHRIQSDRFIYDNRAKGKGLHPRFTWHAGRYIELTGEADITEFRVIRSDIKKVSDFTCDNEILQWIFDAYVRTQLSNIHGCVPSDCPHRERLGYTGDGQLSCGAVMSVFDGRKLYKKWLADIRDCQDKTNGHVQYTAPFYGGGGGPGGWGGAAVIVPYRYYKFYDDIEILKDSYDSIKLYLKYMVDHSEDGIVTHAEKTGWNLGDWCPPGNKIEIPPPFVNTYFLAKCAGMASEIACLLEKNDDAVTFGKLEDLTKQALIEHFFDSKTGSFCSGTQGADAFAADIGIGDKRTLKNLIGKYSELKTFDTGIFGTFLLIKTLFENNEAPLAFTLLTNRSTASFYNMKKQGATTIWENWEGCDSRCHPMFGGIVEFFFSYILGIKRYEDSAGYSRISIRPANVPELKNVRGKMSTKWGEISVDITTDKAGERTVSYNVKGDIEVVGSR